VGRGLARSGRHCGRGHKGQNARSGGGPYLGFEGGQTPFYLRIPKRGKDPEKKVDMAPVPLDRLQHLIDTGRIDPSKPITLKEIHAAGIRDMKDGVRILERVNPIPPLYIVGIGMV